MGEEIISHHGSLDFELLTQAGGLPSMKTVKLYEVFMCGHTLVERVTQECWEHSLGEMQRWEMGEKRNGLKWGHFKRSEMYKGLHKSANGVVSFNLGSLLNWR